MLRKLSVSNYIIIDRLDIDFSDSLNIITGETGAGKSILLGALSLILGQRADARLLLDQNKKCIIEAHFDMGRYALHDFFKKNDLDYDDHTIVRREISENGRSRAFINDTPVNLNILKELGEQLVNLHSQHETLALNNASFQIRLVDDIARHDDLLNEFTKWYHEYKAEEKKLLDLRLRHHAGGQDSEYITFQLNELKEANLQTGEQEQLEQELTLLEHAAEIRQNLYKAFNLLQQDEKAITEQLLAVSELLHPLKKYHAESAELIERTDSVYLELKDIAETIEKLAENIAFDPERSELIQQRLHTIYRLHKKHKTTKIEELLEIRQTLEEKLSLIEKYDELILHAEKKIQQLRERLVELAEQLHEHRVQAIPFLVQQVKEELHQVGMPDAQFIVKIEKLPFDNIAPDGLDKIRFLFSANKGIAPDELRKVASGGELSRLMLILKSLTASHANLPTLIFDEIDAGISGEIADKVGKKMKQLAAQHQIIAITHLPQIASKGDCHFYVYKDNTGEKTVTRIRKLEGQQRIEEIAKLLAGEKLTESAINNAKELLHQ